MVLIIVLTNSRNSCR